MGGNHDKKRIALIKKMIGVFLWGYRNGRSYKSLERMAHHSTLLYIFTYIYIIFKSLLYFEFWAGPKHERTYLKVLYIRINTSNRWYFCNCWKFCLLRFWCYTSNLYVLYLSHYMWSCRGQGSYIKPKQLLVYFY